MHLRSTTASENNNNHVTTDVDSKNIVIYIGLINTAISITLLVKCRGTSHS